MKSLSSLVVGEFAGNEAINPLIMGGDISVLFTELEEVSGSALSSLPISSICSTMICGTEVFLLSTVRGVVLETFGVLLVLVFAFSASISLVCFFGVDSNLGSGSGSFLEVSMRAFGRTVIPSGGVVSGLSFSKVLSATSSSWLSESV